MKLQSSSETRRSWSDLMPPDSSVLLLLEDWQQHQKDRKVKLYKNKEAGPKLQNGWPSR